MDRLRCCYRQDPKQQPAAEQGGRAENDQCLMRTATYHNRCGLHIQRNPTRRIWLQLCQDWQRGALRDIQNGVWALNLCIHYNSDSDQEQHSALRRHLAAALSVSLYSRVSL